MTHPMPVPSPQTGLRALQAMLQYRHPLAALQVFHDELGDVFRVNLPGFKPIVMAGPDAAHFVLVDSRHDLRWRNENDPVTFLLRHGVLVEDGESHDRLRRLLRPSLHKRLIKTYVEDMWCLTDQVTSTWQDGEVLDMLVEMRKIALLILTRTLYHVDYSPELHHLWDTVMGVIGFISPGLWMLWPGIPRPRYRRFIQQMDEYLYRIIEMRREEMHGSGPEPADMLGGLIAYGMEDGLIRDQLLTMLIAGHDTSTALLAWSLYLFGSHPAILQRANDEIDHTLNGKPPCAESVNNLIYLDQVIRETLRLYPPIHLGSRLAARDLEFNGYQISEGDRVIYSIYLTQRHKDFWEDPHSFIPERHVPGTSHTPYSWLAFGGGQRNCIGAAYGQLESKIVLARILQIFNLKLTEQHVHLHMGATLEPRPGVRMRISRRI